MKLRTNLGERPLNTMGDVTKLDRISVTINGRTHTVAAGMLEDALKSAGFVSGAFATAVNGTFVPQSERSIHRLSDGDSIEVLTARQGG